MSRYLRRRLFARLRNRDGATMLEAALITPLLLLLTFSIMEFASILYCHLALQNGAAQATRFAVTGNVSGTMSRVDSIKDAFRRATPTLTVPDSGFTFSHLAVGGGAFVGRHRRTRMKWSGSPSTTRGHSSRRCCGRSSRTAKSTCTPSPR